MNTLEKVTTLISQHLNKPIAKILPDSRIINDLGADSIDVLQMITTLEAEFGIIFDDAEVSSVKTVNDIVAFIDKNK